MSGSRSRFLLPALVVTGCALLTLPWWGLRPLLALGARVTDVSYTRFESVGGGRIALHEVQWTSESIRFRATRIESASLVSWLRTREAALGVHDWQLSVTPVEDVPDQAAPPREAQQRQIAQIAGQLDRWLGTARLENGRITLGEKVLGLPSVTYENRTLHASLESAGRMADMRARLGETLSARLSLPDYDLELTAQLTGPALAGNLHWHGNEAGLHATLQEGTWLPAKFELSGTDWRAAAAALGLPEFYEDATGSFIVQGDHRAMSVAANAKARPTAGHDAPPLIANIRAALTRTGGEITALEISAPYARAHLSEPVAFDFSGRLLSQVSRFEWQADLAGIPALAATGHVQGEALIEPGIQGQARATFTATAANVVWQEVAVNTATLRGRLDWPLLSLDEVVLAPAEGGRVEAKGNWDFAQKRLADGKLHGELPEAALARWLPQDWKMESLRFTGTAAGLLTALIHQGSISVTGAKAASVKPVTATVSWTGEHTTIAINDLTATAGESSLVAAGQFSPGQLRLEAVSWTQAGRELLRLQAPAEIDFSSGLAITALNLKGGDNHELNLNLALQDQTSAADFRITGFESHWLDDWVELPPVRWAISAATGHVAWTKSTPLQGRVSATTRVTVAQAGTLTAQTAFESDGTKLSLTTTVSSKGRELLAATGHVPVRIQPGASAGVTVAETGQFALTLTGRSESSWQEDIATLTGVRIEGLEFGGDLSGTLQAPTGHLRVKATRAELPPDWTRFALPRIEALNADIRADGTHLTLEAFQLKVDGQSLSAQGTLPMPRRGWRHLFEEPLAAIEQGASLQLRVTDAEVAALARYAPAYLAPAGRLSLALQATPDQGVHGSLRITGASSRPLGPLGVLQDMEADVTFEGREMTVHSIRAHTGGEPVVIAGKARWRPRDTPLLDMTLKGENLPFVRQTGLLLRGDLDLKIISSEDGAQTRITGHTRLRDSLFLADIRALIPSGGPRGPARRPPYFSVTYAPLDRWELNVSIRGEDALKVRTTLFDGLGSARLRLGGTLGEPRLTGEVTVDEGRVKFPFATFRVQEGRVTLTEADPYSPRLRVNAASRRLDHDLRMELSGTLDAPVLQFHSSPPLDSEAVLLMVMAGTPPTENGGQKTSAQRMARLGAYLGGDVLRNVVGLETDGERLLITSGEKVSRQGRETYGFEYRLNPRWSLVGEYDEFDDYNAGVKWRITPPGRKESDDEAQ